MNLIAELRSQDTSRIGCAVDGLLMRAADEIERLTAELAHAQAVADGYLQGRTELLAERDHWQALEHAIRTENDWLRAALELLRRGRERRWLPLRGVRDHLTEKVDAFLAGGADETTPPRSKYGRGPSCPKCDSDETSALGFDVLECAACGHEFPRPAVNGSDAP